MTTAKHVTIPDKQAEWLDQNNESPSELLQWAIEKRRGFDTAVDLPKYQEEWLRQEKLSLSPLVEAAIEQRMVEYGFEPAGWQATHGDKTDTHRSG